MNERAKRLREVAAAEKTSAAMESIDRRLARIEAKLGISDEPEAADRETTEESTDADGDPTGQESGAPVPTPRSARPTRGGR